MRVQPIRPWGIIRCVAQCSHLMNIGAPTKKDVIGIVESLHYSYLMFSKCTYVIVYECYYVYKCNHVFVNIF